MKRRPLAAALSLLLLFGAACSDDGDDKGVEAGGTTTTTTAPASAKDLDEQAEAGEDVFADYIEALLGGDYPKAMEAADGPASDLAGYFAAVSQIPSVPGVFKPPPRQAKLHFNGEGATREGQYVVLKAKVDVDATSPQGSQRLAYSGIKLGQKGDKLVVVDFTRDEGPVSEDVLRTNGAKGEGGGVSVEMGPGYAMRGTGPGTQFAILVFSFTNNTAGTVNIQATGNDKPNAGASLSTPSKLHPSESSFGNPAPPGGRGLGFVYFNSSVTDTSGVLTLRFAPADGAGGSPIEVKVPLDTL